MLGVLCALLLSFLAMRAGALVLKAFKPELDPAEAIGLSGLFGLGITGLLILFIGLVPAGRPLQFVPILLAVGVLAVLGGKHLLTQLKFAPHVRSWLAYFVVMLFFIAVIGVLAPSDMRDWDSLAYHLAVPKMWVQSGRIGFVPGIHHSNFPMTADMLSVWAMTIGDSQTAAKAFTLCWTIFGCVTLFGLARRWYGPKSAWWASLAFIGCPVVLWESGTAYVDVPHGLFCGLAVLYLADALKSRDKASWILSGLALGFAMGTKHTGLQTLAAVIVAGTVTGLLLRRNEDPERQETSGGKAFSPLKGVLIVSALALAIASPWYIKSIAYTGNPVYPFFFKQLGGKYWDTWRSEIYTNEQKSFGVGSSPVSLGHAVLGLAYQPGRYVNPGQTEGRGFPTGSIGFAALLAGLVWCSSGGAGKREKVVLAAVGLSLLMWFVLSQQSRYLTSIVVPLAVLAAGAVEKLKFGRIVAAGLALQAAYSGWMLWTTQTEAQLPVVTGQISREEYQAKAVPFYLPAQTINKLPDPVKVALYDEVFGYFLDKPYMWGNPGHSTLIPYESSNTPEQWVGAMKSLGFTHAYANMNRNMIGPAVLQRWQEAMGDKPYTAEEEAQMRNNPDLWWRVLFAGAVHKGLLKPVAAFPEGAVSPQSVLFEFER